MGYPFKKLNQMVGYWRKLTFLVGKENVKNGIYEIIFTKKVVVTGSV
jgi:hypothetical protein